MTEDHHPRLPCALEPSRALVWQQLIRDQHGLLDTDQLRLLDIGPGVVAANLEAQRWRRVLPRVYATFTGPLIREARITGALLYGGPRAVLSHTTAAEEWRMLALDPLAPVHITVPYSCSAVSQPPLVVVHRSRTFPHLVVATDPPRTSRADTVLDLATSEPDAQAGMRRFVALASRGRVPVRELQWRLEERRPRRYGTALADALRLVADGVQSALEQRYACDVELAHALPTAQRQQPFVVDGRTLWEDVSYDLIGIPLTIFSGQINLSPYGYQAMRCDNRTIARDCKAGLGSGELHRQKRRLEANPWLYVFGCTARVQQEDHDEETVSSEPQEEVTFSTIESVNSDATRNADAAGTGRHANDSTVSSVHNRRGGLLLKELHFGVWPSSG